MIDTTSQREIPPPAAPGLTVVVPTYGREQVLLDTLASVLQLASPADEIVIVDQTPQHEAETNRRLSACHASGAVRWLRQAAPSIPQAMNRGLLEASHEIVLFLDDDIVPSSELIAAHRAAHNDAEVWAVVGQVLQPGQVPTAEAPQEPGRGLRRDLSWPFNASVRRDVANCMAGNLSVLRRRAIAAGGFDENFVRVAYRFETEFARRLIRGGGRIVFEPAAGIRHLRAARGGTRAYTDLRRTHRPDHSVGDYYFALSQGAGGETFRYCARRLARSLVSRYLARHPWWLPAKLLGELRGLAWAWRLSAAGPRLLDDAARFERPQSPLDESPDLVAAGGSQPCVGPRT